MQSPQNGQDERIIHRLSRFPQIDRRLKDGEKEGLEHYQR